MEMRGDAYYRTTTDLIQFFIHHVERQPEHLVRGMEEQREMDEAIRQSTEGEGHMENYGRMRFSTIKTEYVPQGEVDHVHRHDAPAIEGIQSLHHFTQVKGAENRGRVSTYLGRERPSPSP